MSYNPQDFDAIIKQALWEDIESSDAPPPSGQFERIMANLETGRGKKRMKSLVIKTTAACLILLFLAAGLSSLFPEKMLDARKTIVNSIIYIFNDRPAPGTEPFYLLGLEPEVRRSLDIARETLPFAAKMPAYIPPGFVLTEATGALEAQIFALRFSRAGDYLTIIQTSQPSALSLTLEPRGELVREVSISGSLGYLLASERGMVILTFADDGGLHYLISGKLDEQEILDIAKSLY